MASLQQYVENCAKWLDALTFIISDNNGIEIASWGEKLEDFQLACAIFQSSIENLSKLNIGKGKSLTLRFGNKILIQRSFDFVYVTIVLPGDGSIGKAFSSFERIEKDLKPLANLISNREN
jgi:Mitogen-activated protein kinase kinase 1 interacting